MIFEGRKVSGKCLNSRLRRLEYNRQRVEAKQAAKDDNNKKKAKTA